MSQDFARSLGLWLCAALLVTAPALAQEPDKQTGVQRAMQRAGELIKAKKYSEAAEKYQAAIKLAKMTLKHSDDEQAKRNAQEALKQAHYNIACCHARLAGQDSAKKDQAMKALEAAVAAGFLDWKHLEKDEDLKSLHAEKAFKDMLTKLKAKAKDNDKKALEERMATALEDLSKENLFDFDFQVELLGNNPAPEPKDKKTPRKTIYSRKDFKGKVLIIEIGGSQFDSTKKHLGIYEALKKKYGKKGFMALSLAYERGSDEDKKKAVAALMKAQKSTMPYALSSDELVDQIPEFMGFPTLLLIDKQGAVRRVLSGEQNALDLEANVLLLLDKKHAKAAEKAAKKGGKDDGKNKPVAEEGPF